MDILPAHRNRRLQEATLLRRVAGGAAANLAVALARLGLPAALLGKVGRDPFGLFLVETLQAGGVDLSHLGFSEQAATGLSFAWVEDVATGEARYLFFKQPTADRTLHRDELDREWLARAGVLHYGSLLAASEPSASAVWAAIAIARAAGVPCVCDANLRLPAWSSPEAARAGMRDLLAASDIVKLNRHELAFITGEPDLEKGADRLWQNRFGLMVVTLDRDGCYFRTRAGAGRVPGYPVQVVDTVACGDAFMAALLYRLTASGPLLDFDYADLAAVERVCRYANAAGALTATRAGAIPALPTRRRIDRFLQVWEPPGPA